MQKSKTDKPPFLNSEDAVTVADVLNRIARAFDVKEMLSGDEARELFAIFLRIMRALINAYPELKPLMVLLQSTDTPNDSNLN